MAHPFQKYNEDKAGKARAKHLTSGYACGGRARGGKAHSDEAEDRKLFKKLITEHEKVEGRASGGRLDKFARGGSAFGSKGKGGKGKGKDKGTKINIAVVAPQGKSPTEGAAPSPLSPPGGGLPKPPIGLPPGGPPPGMPMPPPGGPPGMPPMKRGGKVGMTAGAETGVGRLQKKRAYGKS